eukprot:1151247-Pelagomonas_calceolata.AAC.5
MRACVPSRAPSCPPKTFVHLPVRRLRASLCMVCAQANLVWVASPPCTQGLHATVYCAGDVATCGYGRGQASC